MTPTRARGFSPVSPAFRGRRGGILEAELDPAAAAPVVDLDPSGEVEPGAAVARERRAERALEGAEGDGIDRRAEAVRKGDLQMAVAHAPRVPDGTGGEGEAGGGSAHAEGTGAVDRLAELRRGGAGHQHPVEQEIPGAEL